MSYGFKFQVKASPTNPQYPAMVYGYLCVDDLVLLRLPGQLRKDKQTGKTVWAPSYMEKNWGKKDEEPDYRPEYPWYLFPNGDHQEVKDRITDMALVAVEEWKNSGGIVNAYKDMSRQPVQVVAQQQPKSDLPTGWRSSTRPGTKDTYYISPQNKAQWTHPITRVDGRPTQSKQVPVVQQPPAPTTNDHAAYDNDNAFAGFEPDTFGQTPPVYRNRPAGGS